MRVRVGIASRPAWPAAAGVLFAHLPDPSESVRNLLALLRSGEIEPGGFFAATDESGTVHSATLAIPQPGGQGQLLPPASADPEIEDQLVSAACGWLAGRGAKVTQVNLPEGEIRRGESLVRGGFRRVTRMLHLAVATGKAIPENESVLRLRPYAEIDAKRFAGVLISSYTDTLDCVELDGARTSAEILAGYRGTAGRTPQWFLAEVADEPAGVLLLSSGDRPDEREIAYLGIIPGFRRRGLGAALTRAAIRLAGAGGAMRLTLGVDERNGPAIRMYESQEFQLISRSDVYLKIGPGGRGPAAKESEESQSGARVETGGGSDAVGVATRPPTA
ncbi:MAG TPA: GNAT family N-acetyltransferase [Fimbriiglobus sp.]|jgi:ribosomal protein S18 acetylase RimI-like enzyme